MNNRPLVLIMLLMLALPGYGGQSMRCGSRLVQEGDTKLEVLNRCGEPTFSEGSGLIEQEDEIATAGRLNDQLLLIGRRQSRFSQPVETWHYNCGANRFARVLTFVGPYLEHIKTADRGVGTGGCKQTDNSQSDRATPEGSNRDDTNQSGRRNQPSRNLLDAAIEFRDLHQRNLDAATQTTKTSPPTEAVHRWQDDQGQWHYSATPKP